MLYSLLDSFEDVIISNGELHPRISHLHGGMDTFHWRKAWLHVAMKRGTETVDHVPRTISCVCALFLRQRVFVSCEVKCSRTKFLRMDADPRKPRTLNPAKIKAHTVVCNCIIHTCIVSDSPPNIILTNCYIVASAKFFAHQMYSLSLCIQLSLMPSPTPLWWSKAPPWFWCAEL